MAVIHRYKLILEQIDVPEGYLVCSTCKGKGMLSKYDEGIKSAVHDPDLAVKRECRTCDAKGYVPCLI